MTGESQTTLYAKYAGAIPQVVDLFYEKVLGDEELIPYFTEIDMERQKHHMVAFIGFALGGPNRYTGRNMHMAHADLGITSDHFDLVATHLASALTELGVGSEDVGAIIGTVGTLKGDIVTG